MGHLGNKRPVMNGTEAHGGWQWQLKARCQCLESLDATWNVLKSTDEMWTLFSSRAIARDIRVHPKPVIFILTFSYRTFLSNIVFSKTLSIKRVKSRACLVSMGWKRPRIQTAQPPPSVLCNRT